MTRWKRVALSLASALTAELLVGISLSFRGDKHLLFERLFGFVWFASFLVIAGWMLSLPLVISFDRIDGWRIWVLAVIGSLIGPAIMGTIYLQSELTTPPATWTHGSINFVYMATAISILTTAIYLISLKLFSRPTPPLSY
jgi:hypothetical protein